MLNIAICDDEEIYLEQTESLLMEFMDKFKVEMKINKYCDPEKIIKEKTKYDIIFLDIEMGITNGIDLACQIRKRDSLVTIIYITNYEHYWKRAYKVHAFGFITKPVTREELFLMIEDYIKIKRSRMGEKVKFKIEDGYMLVQENAIRYFYIEKKKKVRLKTNDGEYVVKENLKDILEKLDKEKFYMSHKSCIINMNQVKRLENRYDIIMNDGAFLPLAQAKRNDFLNKLADRFVSAIREE